MTTDRDLAFSWKNLSLDGTLRLPPQDGPHPVVVMMQGSGPSDRTSNGYFPEIQAAFLEGGIGTFAFDKPGCGASTGDWRDHALDDRADQVIAALDVVREQSMVDPNRVGIWGQSQGGWLAQLIASRLPNLPFAIANSGPSLTVPEQDMYGCEHSMRADGYSDSDVDAALRFMSDLLDAAAHEWSYEKVETDLLFAARTMPWYGYADVTDAKDWQLGRDFVREGYDPIRAMEQIGVPFLAIYGGNDVLLPAWQSAEESGHALTRAGNRDSTVVVFPNANHRIQCEPEGTTFAAGYLDLLVDWTAARVN